MTEYLSGLEIEKDFNTTGKMIVPEGTVAILLVPNLADGTYKAGTVTRMPSGEYDAKMLDFLYTLGIGLLVYATDRVEDALGAANTDTGLDNLVAVNPDGEITARGSDIAKRNMEPATADTDLGACDITRMAKA